MELLAGLLEHAQWQGAPLTEGLGGMSVALEHYTLNLVYYHESELYCYVALPLPEESEARFATLQRSAQVCAHLWQDHPFYLGLNQGALRAELVLPADSALDAAETQLAIFLDDVDYLRAQLPTEHEAIPVGLLLGGI